MHQKGVLGKYRAERRSQAAKNCVQKEILKKGKYSYIKYA
jgi:hypothetical protein